MFRRLWPAGLRRDFQVFKKALFVVLQTLLFLLLFAAGSFLPALPSFRSLYLQVQTGPNRVFVLDGLILAVLAYLLIVLIEAARRRLRESGGRTTLALAIAVVLGLALKLGFKSV
jgi:hypothetical protein